MGCFSSKSPGGASPPTDGGAGAPRTDQQDAATELSELTLKLTDSDLNVLKSNPIGVSGDTLRGALSSIGHLVRGARPSLKLTFPVELFVRCVMNKMIDCTSGTDVGTVLSNLMKNEISAINEGIQKLRSAALHAAADNLEKLLRRIPLLMELYSTNDPKLATEKDSFNRLAEAIVEDDLAKAFHTVETREEKIRCVVIACTALVAKAEPGGHSAAIIRGDLGLQIQMLFALKFLQHDVASQLDETHRDWLSFPKDRISRLNSAVGALVHAEAFAAAHGLEPIMLEFLPKPFSIKVLVATGLFGGKTTVGELEGEFSPKELCVIGGLCDTPMPLAVTAAAASYFSGGGASEPAPASAGGARNIGGLRELLEHINLAPDKAAEVTVRAAAFCDEIGADSIGELVADGPETMARFVQALELQPLKQKKLEEALALGKAKKAAAEAKARCYADPAKARELYVAAEKADWTAVARLLTEGANPNGHKNENFKYTALMEAAEKGHLKSVELLIAAGADINAKDNTGSTALYFAKGNKHAKVAEVLRKAAKVHARG